MVDRTQYLIALYEAERERSPPIAPGHLSGVLDRSAAATTEMLQRLDADGLVDYEAYEGATLTDDGRETAAHHHRTYRTLRRFLREVLDVEAAETEALALAGAVSPTVADRLAATLLEEDQGEAPAGGPVASGSRPD